MTDKRPMKRRKLSYEILGLIGVSAFFAALLFLILSWTAGAVVENYCFRNDVVMTEYDWLDADRWIFTLSTVLSAWGFSLLFLALLGDRMTYIRTITAGIEALGLGQMDGPIPLEGRNELTGLAEAINELSDTQKRLREKEQALAREKEQFIRTLSHDIRTPLTAVLAYSEYLAANSLPPEEQRVHLQMIRRKAEQIRDLTALLLDGDKRSPEHFDDAHLLMEQLAAEFEEILEDRFDVRIDLAGCPAFSGSFDVQELRRIFDNLASNVEKYADPRQPVRLGISVENGSLRICQRNSIAPDARRADSYRLGIHSIRRIAHNYGGSVDVAQDAERFAITVILADYL